MEYREFEVNDGNRLAEIIRDTWRYDRLSSNPATALLMGKIYQYGCLSSQNFNLVATQQNQSVGIIMGMPFEAKGSEQRCISGFYRNAARSDVKTFMYIPMTPATSVFMSTKAL